MVGGGGGDDDDDDMADHCRPCAEPECIDVTECEVEALKSLYERMLDPDDQVAEQSAGPSDPRCARPPMPGRPYARPPPCDSDVAGAAATPLQRFDALLTAALESRTAGGSDSVYDRAALPDPVLFAKCKAMPAGAINTTLLSIDVERAVQGAQADRDELHDAVDALMKAEAGCKHGGAVRAAEIAALAQPEAKHAEDAARIGAKAYAAAAASDKSGSSAGTEMPVEVVGYVGCTRSCSPPLPGECAKNNSVNGLKSQR